MPSRYASIADCPTCQRIPQKVSEDIELTGVPKIVPPEVDRLEIILELDDENTPAYCVSTTRLLKCAFCGTYYYWNHYDDDGQHFMDPTCDEITLRRYDPLSALSFLERVVAQSANALPAAFGQMKKAFVEGAGRQTKIAAAGVDPKLRAAAAELAELRERYDEMVRDLADVLRHRPLPGQIQMYAVESLCHHFVSRGDWAALSATLLRHPDPVVRVLTAKTVIGIGTDDAPAIDLVHVSLGMRQAMAKELAKKARLNELVEVLLEIALAPNDATVLKYDHGYGSSSYYPSSARSVALYYLSVVGSHRADLTRAIPALVGLLGQDRRLNDAVCQVLGALVEKKNRSARLLGNARSILDEIEQARAAGRPQLLLDAEVKKLVDKCNERLAPRGRGESLIQ